MGLVGDYRNTRTATEPVGDDVEPWELLDSAPMRARAYVHACVRACARARARASVRPCVCVRACAHPCVRPCVRASVHVRACMCVRIHRTLCACRVCTCACLYKHVYMHARREKNLAAAIRVLQPCAQLSHAPHMNDAGCAQRAKEAVHGHAELLVKLQPVIEYDDSLESAV